MILECSKLVKTYEEMSVPVQAISEVTVEFEEGKMYALVGRSGSGKSTLMNLLGGLDIPSKGDIKYMSKSIVGLKENELSKYRLNDIGFVFQDYNLEDCYSCVDNVTLPMIAKRIPVRKRKKRAIQLLKEMGLEHRLYHRPNQLSGGEKQRVAIARALANDPKIILADEPTGNLDSKNGRNVLKILKDLTYQKKLVLLVTHNIEDAKVADVVMTMHDGKLISEEKVNDN